MSAGSVNRRRSIDSMIVSKLAFSKVVLPGPPGNSVSPLNTIGWPSSRKHVEPGVWPGVWIVRSRRSPTSITSSSGITKS